MLETHMYRHLKGWFESQGYTVYPEVQPKHTHRRADLVAESGGEIVVCEMKMALGMDLLEQAYLWKGQAHRIYVAVPVRRRYPVPHIVRYVLNTLGFGLIFVDMDERPYMGRRVRLDQAAQKDEAADVRPFLDTLTPYHLDGPDGGTKAGGYVTEYSITMNRVKAYLRSRPGEWVLTRDIIKNCETHYKAASPGSSLAASLEAFERDWCEMRMINRKKHFRIKRSEEQ